MQHTQGHKKDAPACTLRTYIRLDPPPSVTASIAFLLSVHLWVCHGSSHYSIFKSHNTLSSTTLYMYNIIARPNMWVYNALWSFSPTLS